jgi:DNA-directed RNA polymerase specialized sigma24 family protein
MPADSRDVPSEEERLGRWVQDHAPAVLGFLRGLVRRQEVAEELLQETFCRAWEARARYVERGKERAWLLTIADRLACDRARKHRREVELDDEDWDGQRRVLLLRYYGDMPFRRSPG